MPNAIGWMLVKSACLLFNVKRALVRLGVSARVAVEKTGNSDFNFDYAKRYLNCDPVSSPDKTMCYLSFYVFVDDFKYC